MESSDLFLANTLLLLAILLFLVILPRALRQILLQKEKSPLNRMVERFEEDELKTTAEGESDKNDTMHEKSVPPKDRSLAYLMEDLPTSLETPEENRGIPFPAQEEEREKPVKIVKEGVPISHNEVMDLSPAPKRKVKLIKQEISISPERDKVSSEKALSEPLKNKAPTKDQKSKWGGDSHGTPPISDHENEESDGNWVEAEIPGLIMEPPPAAERSESIPTFKASPKAKHQSEAEKSQKPPQKEKQGVKVENLASKTEEEKGSQPKKHLKFKTDSPELEIKFSESEPIAVEIKAPIVSHKNIANKEAGQKKAKAPSSKAGKTQKTEAEVTAVPPQREDAKTSPEKVEPKPFLLDLKYLDQEELETGFTVSNEKFSSDMVDMVIARLNALQVDLESQLISIPGELMPRENPVNKNMRKDRNQDSHPDLKGAINESPDKKEVSLEELDSFLFTVTQRKSRG